MNDPQTIFAYDNFREFLKQRYLFEKAHDKKFSFRYFARIAGFKSPSFLKLVMDGQSNISIKSVEQIARALKLNKEETIFFKDLVLFNQASTSEEKNIYAQKILGSHSYKKAHPIGEAQYNYYAQWYFIPVRELVGLSKFKNDPEWIASQINPPIKPSEAKKAIKELLALGLIQQGKDGALQLTNANIHTPNEVTSQSIAQYHQEMMKKAIESIDRIPRQNREISSVTMGVSAEMAKKVKEKIQNFRKELVSFVSQDSGMETVYQLNLQFFPLAQVPDENPSVEPTDKKGNYK